MDGYELLVEIAGPGGSSVCGGVLEVRTVAERETLELLVESGLARIEPIEFGDAVSAAVVEDLASRIGAFARIRRLAENGTGTVDDAMRRAMLAHRDERADAVATQLREAEVYEPGTPRRENADDDVDAARGLLSDIDALLRLAAGEASA